MSQDCKYCGEEFKDDNLKRKYCDDCLRRKSANLWPTNSSVLRMVRNREFLKKYKKDKSCEMCGYNRFPEILDFHHKVKGSKYKGVNVLSKSLKSIKIIKEEINKCIILCPNCHRELHLKEKKA